MSRIAAVAPVLPAHAYAQRRSPPRSPRSSPTARRRAALERLHAASGVQTRHLVLPLEDYATWTGSRPPTTRSSRGTDLAEQACRCAAAAGLAAEDVDFILFTSVTGVSAPSLDALLVARLGLRPDVKRRPGVRARLRRGRRGHRAGPRLPAGHPRDVALLVSVELCSLTIQHGDDSMANLVSSGLFGDGAAAVVMVGDERAVDGAAADVVDDPQPALPRYQRELGWDVGGGGFRIVLAASLADIVERAPRGRRRGLLAAHDLKVGDVGRGSRTRAGPGSSWPPRARSSSPTRRSP